MFVERVDNALEYVSIDVQIITIQLDGESSGVVGTSIELW